MWTYPEEHIDQTFEAYVAEQEAWEAFADATCEAYIAEQEAQEAAASAAFEAQLAEQEAYEAAAEAIFDEYLAEQEVNLAIADAVFEAQLAEIDAMEEALECCYGDTLDSELDCFPIHKEWYEDLDPDLVDFASQFETEEEFDEYMESRL